VEHSNQQVGILQVSVPNARWFGAHGPRRPALCSNYSAKRTNHCRTPTLQHVGTNPSCSHVGVPRLLLDRANAEITGPNHRPHTCEKLGTSRPLGHARCSPRYCASMQYLDRSGVCNPCLYRESVFLCGFWHCYIATATNRVARNRGKSQSCRDRLKLHGLRPSCWLSREIRQVAMFKHGNLPSTQCYVYKVMSPHGRR